MSNRFQPRDWQERFVRQYQTDSLKKKNFLLEACTSAGKTGGSLLVFVSLQTILDWKFVVVVTPSEHLRKQYARDARELFDLNLYYSGTDNRLGGLPNPQQLLDQYYQGLVVSYQWLTKPQNAPNLAKDLEKSFAGKVFLILDEVHHASHELSFGQACKIAFPDSVVSHRLMTSGTPFRSDKNRILGNWLIYEPVDENTYKCVPNFRYTLADALRDEIIPSFSFVSLEGEFKYIRNKAKYEGQKFTSATTEQKLRDALNTAIFVDGDWVKEAVLWAHKRMKRDRAKGLAESATYVRVPKISAAKEMKKRIKSLTGEEALIVVSKEDDDSNFSANFDSSRLIEEFAAETGIGARSWIIGVNMLGEGISINRLKYRIHATNVCAPLSFMQDLGRLLRLFPQDSPESVETLIPAHPTLIQLAIDVLDEVAHVINGPKTPNDDQKVVESNEDEKPNSSSLSNFIPLASTGEMGAQIVDGEEISPEYTKVAEWLVENNDFFRDWHKTPAHLAHKLMNDPDLFEFYHEKYREAINSEPSLEPVPNEEIPLGFPSEYATMLSDEKAKYARKKVHKKVNQLAYLLYPNDSDDERKKHLKEIHNCAKSKHGFSSKDYIGYQGWESIYKWLLERIAASETGKRTEEI